MILSALTVALVLSGAPQSRPLGVIEAQRAPTPRPAPSSSQAGAPTEEGEVQQVCRNQEVTGSRFPVRVCRSVRQNGADRDESREMLRQMQGQRKQEPLI